VVGRPPPSWHSRALSGNFETQRADSSPLASSRSQIEPRALESDRVGNLEGYRLASEGPPAKVGREPSVGLAANIVMGTHRVRV
jgi:hypothetical protein